MTNITDGVQISLLMTANSYFILFFLSFSIFTVAVTVDGGLLDNNEMTLLAAELSNPDYVVHWLQTFSVCRIQPQVIESI